MSAEDCTNYLSCAPSPTPFVPSLPADVPAHEQVLAATGFDGIGFLLVVVAVVVVVVGLLLIVVGRRSR
jgi:hypothetical protein